MLPTSPPGLPKQAPLRAAEARAWRDTANLSRTPSGHDLTEADWLKIGAVEPTTPIGVKLVFEQWLDEDGAAFYTAELVYQSTDQLRAITPLSFETPPMIVPIRFAGAKATADGLIPEAELLRLFDSTIEAYYDLEDAYTEDALSPSPCLPLSPPVVSVADVC